MSTSAKMPGGKAGKSARFKIRRDVRLAACVQAGFFAIRAAVKPYWPAEQFVPGMKIVVNGVARYSMRLLRDVEKT